MYYGRYSREARRWLISWPLPSEILAQATIEPELKIVGDGFEMTDTEQVKSPAE